ncbi:hypothetical protein Back11_37510 [Paenibacillus baekrokdamisoli]|uniref:Uncharacterized protein n=1 Tax=Paenibacillus baekrokdamisoli TaxID=1712516 RepID=A0A3G9IVC5_9BACL|nr:S-layer homology domain-containing protein [Paenibacillus baekrokdamisoli]MBB3072542.1 hypothetical protein [Paenibacillus baekrokdamisoli]BBH22406.1 hypothetical protein Back11_37510 [Paenibacillus baekrokdamisoli]
MQRLIYHRVIIIMMALMLATMSIPMGLSVSSAEESPNTMLHSDFEEGGSSAWTPVSGNWSIDESGNDTLFFDDFDNGSAARWTNNGGTWSIIQNGTSQAYQQSSGNGASEMIAGDPSWTDYSYEADVKLMSGAGAMMNFRYQDRQHFYFLYMSSDYIRIMKQDGSNQDWLKAYDGPSLKLSEFVRIKVEVAGNLIKVYRDGELVLSTTDDPNYFTSGKIALATWASAAEFDNVSVKSTSMNHVYSESDSNGGESHAGDLAWSNYSVQAQVTPKALSEDGTIGISLRYQDSDNRYSMQYAANGNIQIIKIVNGVATTLAEAPYSIVPGKSYSWKGVARGKYLDFYINDIKLLSAVDTAFIRGKISLHLSKATASYDNITVTQVSVPVVSDGNTTYYVSSSMGDDANDGLSEAAPWKTLNKVNEASFQAGDNILLRSGDIWNEPLILKGSGSEALPITIASYGSGNKPIITWNAPTGGAVVTGHNLSNWVIKGLAVKIIGSSTLSWSNITAGIQIFYDNSTLYKNLLIDGNDVYSTNFNSNTNGIMISAFVPGTDNKEAASNITISNNTVHDVGWYAITTTGWDTAKNEELRSQILYGNVKVSGNHVYSMASQGIVVQNAHNSVIERNGVHDGGLGTDTWGPGGLWFIASRDSVIKFNEVYNMKDASSGYDGSGINVDWNCDNIIVQYNYSHGNKGNGITTMSNYGTKILNNKVQGNQALQANGRGQIALGNFTGRPDLSTGLHDVEVANNTIIVDLDHTVAVNTALNPYGTWTGNSIHDNNIIIKEGLSSTGVFSIDRDTSVDIIDHNNVFSELSQFRSIFHGTSYASLAAWQEGTGFDQATRVLPLDQSLPTSVTEVVAVPDGYVKLSWAASADQDDEIAHYNIYRSTEPAFTPAYSNMVGESTSTSFVDREEVQAGTTYYYKIEAEDRNGNIGMTSATVSITTGPTIPTVEQPKVVDFMSLRDGYSFNIIDLPTLPYITGIPNIQKVQLYVDDIIAQELKTPPYAYTITGLNNGEHRLKYKVYDQTGASIESKQIRIIKQVNALRSLFTPNKPIIDGSLNDWSSPDFHMNQRSQVKNIENNFSDLWSPQKLEAAGYTRWDEQNLYMAIEVSEDQHHLAITNAEDLWKGSSVQIAIDPERGNAPGSKGYTEFAFGLSDDGEIMGYRYHAITGKSNGVFAAGEIKITRDHTAKKTSYEIAIPWNEIIPAGVQIKEGSALGISILANYSDGSFNNPNNGDARNGWIEYNSGIGAGKAPNQYGYLVLSKKPFAVPTLSGKTADGKVLLSWLPVDGATGYTLKSGTTTGVYSSVVHVGNTTNYEAIGLALGITRYFAIEAYDSYGESGLSNEVNFTLASTSNTVPNNNTNSNSPDKAVVVIKDGTAYVKLGINQTKVDVPLSEIGVYPLQVQFNQASITVSQAVLNALKVQGGNIDGASVEVRMTPVADPALTATPISSDKAQIKVAGQVYDFSVSLLTTDQRRFTAEKFSGGITISLPYDRSDVNEQLLGIYYYNEVAKQWEYVGGIVDSALQQVSFTPPHPGIYSVLEYRKTFSDVPSGHWAEQMIQNLAAKHIIQGVTDSKFNPSGTTTRAEFVTLLAKALQLQSTDSNASFSDVKSDAWYANSIASAVQAGIVSGISTSHFAPEQQISRAEMVTMIIRALGIPINVEATTHYADASDIPAWALPYVAAASEAELVRGRSHNQFAPQLKATRAEAAQLIYNLLGYIEDKQR